MHNRTKCVPGGLREKHMHVITPNLTCLYVCAYARTPNLCTYTQPMHVHPTYARTPNLCTTTSRHALMFVGRAICPKSIAPRPRLKCHPPIVHCRSRDLNRVTIDLHVDVMEDLFAAATMSCSSTVDEPKESSHRPCTCVSTRHARHASTQVRPNTSAAPP